VLTETILRRRPWGAAELDVGAEARISPACNDVATPLEVDMVIVEPSGETVRVLIPAESSTLVVLGMTVE